ncbi:LysR family transcriptional regulator [Siculibacillus lacustris]|nr:LysR family transcriptional regulator [Siculibacillus lacustris]
MRYLKLLFVLSEQKSLRKASEVLSLTQPAATKTLHELEDLIGERLFVRTAQGLIPTALGEAAIRYARLVFKDLDALGEELGALRAGGIGNVRIGSMASQTGLLLPRAIAALKRDFPRINISVVEETSDHLLRALEDDDLDLVVARIPQGWPSDNLDFDTFGEEIITVVARRGHPADGERRLALADLADQTWIAQLHPAPLREIWDQIFREERLALPRSVVETSSTILTVSLIEQSDMVALLPLSVARNFGRLGLVTTLPLTISAKLRPFGLIRRRNRIPTPAMETVARILRECAEGDGATPGL